MKKLLLILLPILLCINTQAQDTAEVRRNAVTVSLLPLISGAELISYERALPCHSSLEVEMGAQGLTWDRWRGSGFAPTRPGFATAVGCKYYFPINKDKLPKMLRQYLSHRDYFVKMRLAYVRQWSSYDLYVGNQGWDILTERHTYHEDDITLAIIFGHRFVGDHGFVFSPFVGYNFPLLIAGPFHTIEYPGTSAVYVGWLTAGIKLGWAF
ncbi:MAG: hypothetical protein J5641_04660 [Bacteroidales bacterium]|nr:hypothetical protein [Bacteroidales bacterium]